MAARKKITKEKIISEAFKVWGKGSFCSTSLSDLAGHLGVSKTALYRHFRNKATILSSMEKIFTGKLTEARLLFLIQAEKKPIKSVVEAFLRIYITFFLENPYYFDFLFHLVAIEMRERNREPAFLVEERDTLSRALDLQDLSPDSAGKQVIIRFIFATGAFLVHLTLQSGKKITRKEKEKLIKSASTIVLHGVGKNQKRGEYDFQAMLEKCSISRKDIEQPDRLFSAIAKVVAEEGMLNATTDKIAKKVGITKSSLYFYFKDKDEMLNQMVRRQQERFIELFNEREKKYKKIEEKLLCYIITISTWFLNNPTIITVFNWIWFQRVEISFKKPDHTVFESSFSFIGEAQTGGSMKIPGLSGIQFIGLITRLIIQEINIGLNSRENSETILQKIEYLYTLVLEGIHHLDNRRMS
jgi:AcrR family transcriptional regulator